MSNTFQLRQALRDHPQQAAYWRDCRDGWHEPTLLVRDHLRGHPGPRPRVATALGADTVTAARTLTSGDPMLLRVLGGCVLALLAARATDREEVHVFLPAAGTAGDRAVPVTVRVTGATTGRELLGAVRTAYLEASAQLDIPVRLLLDEESTNPSDLMLALDGELSVADAESCGCPLLFELCMDGEVGVRYDARLFSGATATRLADTYATLLTGLLGATASPLSALLGPTDAERDLITRGFNATDAPFPAERTLHSFLEERAALTPDRVAVASEAMTYGELNAAANRLARVLRARGVGSGGIVGVCMPRSPREIVASYAVLKAGGAYLPLDPALPRNRIDHIVEHSGTRLVITAAETRDAVAGHPTVDVDDLAADPAIDRADAGDLEPRSGPEDLAYVIYTSGSTGRPKGVMVEHRAIVNRLWWMQRAWPLDADDIVLHKTPFTFDVSVWEIFWWSLAGASVVTLPDGDERDPDRIAATIAGAGVTTAHFVPSMLNAFLRYLQATGDTPRLASLRTVFASGEALAAAPADTFARELGGHARLVNLYGPTEAAVDVTCQPCAGLDPTRAVPIGRPIDNIRLYIRTRDGDLAPVGTAGELCIAGTGLARGYLGAPELTDAAFVPNPFEPSGRLYRTGDLARWQPDGTIEFLGRIDAQVKIRGYRIEPGEIERVAANCAGVADCAVVAVPDANGEVGLAAYVVSDDGYDETRVRNELAAELPAYMIPRAIVEIAAVPTNRNGKRDLKALLDMQPMDGEQHAAHTAPRDDRERALAAIWAEALGVDRVGIDDNFFALGGDSIKFIAVLARARAEGLRFSFQQLFANPTIAALAALVSAENGGDRRPETPAIEPFGLLSPADAALVPDGATDAYPMSALQVGLLYEAARSETEGMYHDILSYRIADSVDIEVFADAVDTLARRHPIFRTSFHLAGFSEPVQVVHGDAPSPLRVHDLRGMTEAEQARELAGFGERELRAGFRPGSPDLVRVHLHQLDDKAYQYTLSYHDAALDGWSVNTIHRDLFTTYVGLLDGRTGAEPRRSPVEPSYLDFIALEREAIDSREQRDFWLWLVDGAESTRLPRSVLEPAGPATAEVIIHDVPLPAELSRSVLGRAHDLRVPVKSLLLAAHAAVLGFVAGTEDVLTGYEHSGRPEAEGGEAILGLFLNTVPFRVDLGSGGSWTDLVNAVYEAETAMLPARRYPMAEIKKAIGGRELLFETVFNFTHFHVLKSLGELAGFGMVRSVVNAKTEFPFRAEFSQDAVTDEVRFCVHYHANAFTAEHIDRIGGYYRRALELITTRGAAPLRPAELLGEEERARLRSFSGPTTAQPSHTFPDLFDRWVRRGPGRTALRHGRRTLTYAELDTETERVAAFLRARGVRPGDVVATLLPRGIPWAVTVLALLRTGAGYLPLDPDHPADRMASVLRRSGCRHVVSGRDTARELRAGLAVRVPETSVLTYEDAEAVVAQRDRGARPSPDDAAYVIFTSGSTGEPKGAVIRHSGMLNHLLAKERDLGIGAADRVAQTATQCFDISVWQLLVAWMCGGSTVIYGHDDIADLPGFTRSLAEDGVTVLEVVPSYLDAMLTETAAGTVAPPSLRYLVVTGETVSPALTRRWFARNPAVPMVNAYGPTEASDDVTHHLLHGPETTSRVPVGRPILNTGIHVVDAADFPRPVGSYGEVVVTGAGVGDGYVNDEERTAAAFRPNTFDDRSALLYRTGDIGRWLPGGVLDLAGRLDHQVKVRGHRIELSEVDGALARLPGVDTAVTLAMAAAGGNRLVAFHTGTGELDLGDVQRRLAETLPSYLHPEVLVHLAEFPLTGNGKIDRGALERMPVGNIDGDSHREPPADEHERLVRDLFAEVLGIDPQGVGVTDNFFEIGGHSLAAMKVAARSGGRISLRDLLALPTARRLAKVLAAAVDSENSTSGTRELLVNLTAAAGATCTHPKLTLVCVPYAGGSAVTYVTLARWLADGGAPAQVLGVELPARGAGDNRPEQPVERLAEDLAAEIHARTDGPVAVLGHCAGSALGLLLVRALRHRDVDVRRLFVISKLLRSTDPDDHAANDVVGMTEREILDWLADNTGLDDVDRLSTRERADLASSFRYDTTQATRGFRLALTRPDGGIGCGITSVLATDDALVDGYERTGDNWAVFSPDIRLVVTGSGGHYLNTTRPALLAEAVRADLDL